MSNRNLFLLILYSVGEMIFCGTAFSQNETISRSVPRPNILLIVVDDMKWNSTGLSNANNILPTPAIDRIGNEGASFNYYCTNSMCVPGRTTLFSGQYSHLTNTMNNHHYAPAGLIMIPEILKDNGYHTALCGKWMLGPPNAPRPEFDYWLCTRAIPQTYFDTAYYFSNAFVPTEHLTDLENDSAAQLISTMDTPFFLLLSYNATHIPWIAQTQFAGQFDTCIFDAPGNFQYFSNNYMSLIYSNGAINNNNTLQTYLRNYYEMLAGVEQGTARMLDSLQSRGILNNTMVIFTSDNGYIIGAHKLKGKYLPYDEDMKMPLYIRYPSMFTAGTVVENEFAINTDLAPTILQAAGVTDTFGFQGFALSTLVNGINHRDAFLYEQTIPGQDSFPAVRTYRDKFFQYNKYYCSDTTEELFDMIQDSLQITNLVLQASYQQVLWHYRIKLDSIRMALNDTVVEEIIPCSLVSTGSGLNSVLSSELIGIYPNPAFDYFIIHSEMKEDQQVEMYNALGEKISDITINFSKSNLCKINCEKFTAGVYLIRIKSKSSVDSIKLVIAR